MSSQVKLLTDILEESYPDECLEVGPTYLHYIATGQTKFSDVKGGSYMDTATSLALLASVATVIQLILDIYDRTKKDNQEPPDSQQVIEEVEETIREKKIQISNLEHTEIERFTNIVKRKFSDQ